MATCEIAEKLRVVILYDHPDSVGRAMAVYARLARGLQCECQPELSIWRLDDATSAGFAVKADFDIAGAGIVLMAVHGSEPCPPAFLHWRERAWQDEGAPPRIWIALVAAPDEPAPVAGAWTNTLRLSATQIHPGIFVWEPVNEPAAAALAPGADLPEPATVVAALAPDAMPADGLYREGVSADPGLVAAHRD